MKKKWLLGMMLAPALTFAGGFQLNLQGAKAVGLGGAFTGWANDASSVFFNPGGMTQLSGHNLYLGVQYVRAKASIAVYRFLNCTSCISSSASSSHVIRRTRI